VKSAKDQPSPCACRHASAVPKATSSGAPVSAFSPTAEPSAGKLSQDVLVIDEDESVQRALAKILEPEGFNIISALHRSKTASALARERHPRIIILGYS